MSNFWANKLGGGVRPPAPAPAPQQQPGGAWWSPTGAPYPQAAAAPETVPEAPQTKPPARAMVAKQDTNCPDCGGTNFFRPVGMPNAMSQCYECGYNSRFHQTTAGLPSGDKSAPSTPAKQTASGGAGGRSNYKPGTLIRADGTV